MKQVKRLLIVVFMLLGCVAIQATDDLITQQITIKLDSAGTLLSKIGSTNRNKITNLKIIGEINGTDLRIIREMAGRNNRGGSTLGKLATLDLSEAKIVSGGEYYYSSYSTEDDVLGNWAFGDCSSLTSVVMSSGVTSIGIDAFYGCSSLASVVIPSSVTSIGYNTFHGCSSLTSVEIPSSVTSIGNDAFYYCSSLASVEIPSSVTSIGISAFGGCSSLTSVYVSWETPVSITADVFDKVDKQNCTLYVPQGTSQDYLNAAVWGDFENIVEYKVDNVTTIKLDEAGTLPDKIDSTKKYQITNLKIIGEINGTDLRMIRDMAGSDYQGRSTSGKLATLDLSEAKIVSGGEYYYNPTSDFFYYTEDNVLGEYAFSGCSSLASVEIPSGVTSIGDWAFNGCSSLTSIEIPSGVTSIGDCAFENCSSLTSVDIPSGVTSIGSCAFENCNSLTSVDIPSSVTSIGARAFYGCSSLTSIEIPYGVTSIGGGTFSDCSSLASVEIPSSVTIIAYVAFYNCSRLASVVIPSSVTWIDNYAFYGCSSLTSVVMSSSVTSIGDYTFGGCSSLTSIEIPSGVTSIGDCAFRGCSSLTSVEIPSSVTSIGNSAFSGCSSLASIEIPSSVTSIGNSAFYGCSSLASVEMSSIVTSIGNYTFGGCSSLTSIEIPSSVTSIGNDAFWGCSSLASVVIPSSVTSIGSSAFSNCSSLASVEIPSSVTSIGEQAFSCCDSLASIYVSWETPVSISTDVFTMVDKQKCTLYVPQGTSTNYKNAATWNTFENIVEHDKTHYYRIGGTKHYLFGEDLSVDNLTLEDGKDFVANVPFKATNASYSRTMTSNWGTLCLPFAVETASNADSKFYEIKGVDNDVITLTQLNGTIAAGTPVLVYSTNETNDLNISASDVDVVTAPADGAQASGWQLVGSFAETEVPDDGYIISKNKFWLTSDLTSSESVKAVKTKGLRAYLKLGSDSSAAKAHVLGFAIDDEDKTSAIDAIDGLTEGTAEIYDIQGRRTDRLQKGLNIVKTGSVTKKIMVK